MDYTGTRREGRGEPESSFYKEVGDWLVSKLHPTVPNGFGGYREPARPDVVKSWRLGGYRLASRLLPMRRRRFPEELAAFIDGMRQRMQEYENEGGIVVEEFDVEACEKEEARANKFLRLATHPSTPVDEARSAASALAKMIGSSELVLLSWGRVSHFAQRFQQMEEAFAALKASNPFDFFFGPQRRH